MNASRTVRVEEATLKLVTSIANENGDGRSLVSVDEAVAAALARVQDLAGARGVELFVQCGGGRLRCDAEAPVAALGKVVFAALEAAAPCGAVFVATYRTAKGGQFWTVQDTGVGLPPRGWAIALASARDVIERHGGHMKIEAAQGSGTLVSIAWGDGTLAA